MHDPKPDTERPEHPPGNPRKAEQATRDGPNRWSLRAVAGLFSSVVDWPHWKNRLRAFWNREGQGLALTLLFSVGVGLAAYRMGPVGAVSFGALFFALAQVRWRGLYVRHVPEATRQKIRSAGMAFVEGLTGWRVYAPKTDSASGVTLDRVVSKLESIQEEEGAASVQMETTAPEVGPYLTFDFHIEVCERDGSTVVIFCR